MSRRSALLAVLVAGASACGGGSRGSAHPSSGIAPGAPARYLQIATAANTAIEGAKSRLGAGGEDLGATDADLSSIAGAKRTFDAALRSLDVPPAARPAVSALLAADAVLEERLDAGAAAATPAALDADTGGILDAGNAAVSAAADLRRALGLPPPA